MNESIRGQSSLSADMLAQLMMVEEVSKVKVDKSLYKKYEEDDIDYIENFLSSETKLLEDFEELMEWIKENMEPKAKALLMDANSHGPTIDGLKGLSWFIIEFPGKSHPSITAYMRVSFNVLPYIQNIVTKIINTYSF